MATLGLAQPYTFGLAPRIAAARDIRIRHLRHRISALENEADASTQHARALRDEALALRGELWDLEDGDPGTLSE